MRRVAALMAAILPVISKKMILVLMSYRNSARRIGSDKQQNNKGLPHKVFGLFYLGQYLENLYEHHHFQSGQVRLVTTARAQLLDICSYVETSHIGALTQAKICFLGVDMINKNSLSWVGRGPT